MGWETKRRRNRGRECRQMGWVYNGFFRWNHHHRHINSVGDSIDDSVGDSATSLYDYLSLNPSVIPSVKSSEKTARHHAVASFHTNCILRRRNGRYIPTEIFHRYIPTISPTELGRWYIPTYFETELFPSVIINDGKISSIILSVFSGFLEVFSNKKNSENQPLPQCQTLLKIERKLQDFLVWSSLRKMAINPVILTGNRFKSIYVKPTDGG